MRLCQSLRPLLAVTAVSLFLSGCALPPIITAASFAADIFSLSGTGKTVTDHGISFVMQRDCAMLRVFDGEVCRDYAPDEDTPEGALVALALLADPMVNPAATDPMVVPRHLAYLDDPLGLAVASGPGPGPNLPAAAFASFREGIEAGGVAAAPDGFAYLAAGIHG